MFDRVRHFLKILGPGLVTGASDDDPSGVATYSQGGAQFGFAPLWLAFWTLPLLMVIQEMCGRVAIVTRKGLIQNLRTRIPAPILWGLIGLLAVANGINAGADLGMMAASAKLVVPQIPVYAWLIAITALTLGMQIFLSYRTYAQYLKWLTVSLFAYILVAFIVHVPWMTAFRMTFVPFALPSRDFALFIIAFLGTTISPYLYFWQANQENEERKALQTGLQSLPHRLRDMCWDVFSGMTFSNAVAWFIIVTGAVVLGSAHGQVIETADQAARLLEPLAGRFAAYVFALGTLATGLLAVPVLTSVIAYAICEALGHTGGLSKTWREAKLFYGIVVVLTLLGILINFLPYSPVHLLILSAIGNAIVAPPLLAAIVWLGNASAMRQYKNGVWSNALGALTVAIMSIASIVGIYLLFVQ
jgi:Mn2+/Fe2+ NRAMP family transporter